jgi:hypothetical protein
MGVEILPIDGGFWRFYRLTGWPQRGRSPAPALSGVRRDAQRRRRRVGEPPLRPPTETPGPKQREPRAWRRVRERRRVRLRNGRGSPGGGRRSRAPGSQGALRADRRARARDHARLRRSAPPASPVRARCTLAHGARRSRPTRRRPPRQASRSTWRSGSFPVSETRSRPRTVVTRGTEWSLRPLDACPGETPAPG